MKKSKTIYMLLVIFMFIVPVFAVARDVAPIVNTDWLESNLKNPRVIILDVRKVEDYKTGHIPGAVNVFFGSWVVAKEGLRNEVPPTDDLFDTIGSAGIGPDSIVVVVSKVDAMGDRTDGTRVAWTLKHAGVENVALLDGGYNKWVNDKKPLSTDIVKPKSATYKGKIGEPRFVNKAYVLSRLGKALIIDVREPDFYLGKTKLDFVPKAGHVAGAVNLPTLQAFNQEGTYKERAALEAIVTAVVGKDTSREIITVCDSGKVASVWAFVLSEVMGFKNVKDYDGSMEDWSKDPAAPIEP
jgi:thiosulfate/3-mercaptopyruvate sulfurtransferase